MAMTTADGDAADSAQLRTLAKCTMKAVTIITTSATVLTHAYKYEVKVAECWLVRCMQQNQK